MSEITRYKIYGSSEFEKTLKDVLYQHYMKDYTPKGSDKKSEAMKIVSQMHHKKGEDIVRGEMIPFSKAVEIYNAIRGKTIVEHDEIDLYMILNEHCHNYIELFKEWFGDMAEPKIMEAAIHAWLMDVDCRHSDRVGKYFGI